MTEQPKLDPTIPEGRAILDLYSAVKAIEHSDGSWPGGDVTDLLAEFFARLGLDEDSTLGGPSQNEGRKP